MTPGFFLDCLSRLGWNQAHFASRTGTSAVTVSRWVHGKHPIPEWVGNYLMLALSIRESAKLIERTKP